MRRSKRIILLAIFFLLISLSLHSRVSFKGTFSPSILYDNSPLFFQKGETYTKRTSLDNPISGSWERVQDSVRRFDSRKPLLALNFEVETENVFLAIKVKIKEDLYNFMSFSPYSNIPFLGNTKYAVYNAQYPSVAFLEYNKDFFTLSVGRRLLKKGPGSFSFILSDEQVYLDHIYTKLKYSGNSYTLNYSFYAISSSNSTFTPTKKTEVLKTFFIHGFSYNRKNLILSFSELNCVYDTVPTIGDFTPFALWHNQYQEEHSNVMIEVSAEVKIEDVRLYLIYAQDDICLNGEKGNDNKTKPTALGFALGLDWLIKEGTSFISPDKRDKAYTKSDDTLKEDGGTHFIMEGYWATNWLYNRRHSDVGFPSDNYGKLTLPYRFYSNSGGMTDKDDAYYLGFPYGPGSIYIEAKLTSENRKSYCAVSLSALLRGEIDIETEIDQTSEDRWLLLEGEIDRTYFLSLSYELLLDELYDGFTLFGSFTLSHNSKYSFNMQATFGLALTL